MNIMKKLVALFLVLFTLSALPVMAEEADIPKIIDANWMAERIAQEVGYKPYFVTEKLGDEQNWKFIMAGGRVCDFSVGDDLIPFLAMVSNIRYDWYATLPNYIKLSEEQDISVGDGIVYVDTYFTNEECLVISYIVNNVWLPKGEWYHSEDGVYLFHKRYVAQAAYESEMSSLQYVGGLLMEAK